MELESFKSILLRKADGNKNIVELLNNLEEDVFVNSVVDALEKMAKPTNLTGTNASGPVTSFGANLDKTDINQLRDALGHHLSHYKAALKAHHAAPEGAPEKTKMREVADKHLEHVIPLMHLAARAKAHSKGKLEIDYPPHTPWETNYTTLQMANTGKPRLLRDPKLLRVRPAKNAKRNSPNSTAIPDYHYLEMPPHPGHDAVSKMPHSGGYPWEEIQLGAPADVEAKKAFLHIEDVPDKKEYTPHEFDQHPLRISLPDALGRTSPEPTQDIQADRMDAEMLQTYAVAHAGWRSGEHFKKWMDRHKAAHAADPESYKKRGQAKGPHFYEGIPLQEQPGHVHSVPAKPKFQAPVAAAPTGAAPPAGTPASVPATQTQQLGPGVKVRSKAAEKEHPLEGAYKAWSSLPKQHQDSLIDAVPGLREYANQKGGVK